MNDHTQIILSHFQTEPLWQHRETGQKQASISPDLGLTVIEVEMEPQGARFPNGELLTWDFVAEINSSENNCYLLEGGELQKITLFSEETNRVYSLMPTERAPTMLISGIPMHRIKGTDPYQDTLEKIRALKPVTGRVLDTATGLGYTAIEASKTAEHVTTIELDPAALEIAKLNPWSRKLFNPSKITKLIGDSLEVVESMPDEQFSCIIHDPPAFALAGHLYSREFYAELYRVLKRRGRLFHYIGNPESKSGHNITRGAAQRLRQAGFEKIKEQPRAFGVLAYK